MNVIIKPIITEKSIQDANAGKFTFMVAIHADKKIIRREIEEKFKVNVIGLSTVTTKGRAVRTGKKRTEKTMQPIKKAIARLKTGQKIDLFDVGA